MTWEQYWYGDPMMVTFFREADLQRQKRQNNEAWVQGIYFWDALTKAIHNLTAKKGEQPQEYAKEPLNLFGEPEKEERDEKAEALRASLYMKQMERAGRNWGKQ